MRELTSRRGRWVILCACAASVAGGARAWGQDYWWGGTAGTTWGAGNFFTTQAGTTAWGPGPSTSNTIVFATTGATNLNTTLGGTSVSVQGVRTASNFTLSASITSTAGGVLTVGTSGVQVAGTGSLTIFTPLLTSASNYGTDVTQAAGTLTLAGALTTAGAGLVKTGAGLLVLGAGNTFGGTTTVSGGTLQIGNGGTLGSVSGNIVNNATLVFNRGNDFTYSGVISGTGNLIKRGNSVMTLSQAMTGGGGTVTVDGGVIVGGVANAVPATAALVTNGGYFGPANGQNLGSLSGTGGGMGLGGGITVTVNQNVNTVFGGDVYDNTLFSSPDTSRLVKNGTGTLTLTGNGNFLGGGFSVNGGTLRVGNGGTTGVIAGGVTVGASGTLVFERSDLSTYNGVVSGAGALTKRGNGRVILSQPTTLTGVVTVEAGDFQLNPANAFATASGVVTTGGFLLGNSTPQTIKSLSGTGGGVNLWDTTLMTLDQAGNTSYAGAIFDQTRFGSVGHTGSLIKTGAGTITLTGNSNVTGGSTTITAGAIRVGNGGTTGTIPGRVTVGASGSLVFERSDVVIYTGSITGAGAVTQAGTGTLVLTANSPFTGVTRVMPGSRLQIGSNSASGSVAGNIVSDGTLEFSRSNGFTYTGVISGAGSVVHSGSGYRVLSGSSTYAGSTTVNGGLVLESAGLPATTGLQMRGGGYFVGGPANAVQTIASLDGFGQVSPFLNKTLVLNQAVDTTYSGTIYDNTAFGTSDHTGNFIKTGAGTFTTTGQIILGGLVTVSGGTLKLGAGGAPALLRTNLTGSASSSLVFDFDGTSTLTSTVTTTGSLVKTGPGTLVVTQMFGNLGNLTISQGTLQYGDGVTDGGTNGYAGALSVVNNSNIAANLPLGAFWNNGFGGTGSFTVLAGTQTFNVPMTSAGGVRVFGGSLRFQSGGQLPTGANVTITNGLLDLSGVSHTVGNLVLDGTGSRVYVTNTGAGSAELTLNGNASSTTGAATVRANLALPAGNHDFTVSSGSLEVTGSVSGTGSVSKLGAGTLTFSGALPYTGLTTVTAGTLRFKETVPAGNITVATTGSVVFDLANAGILRGTMAASGATVTKTGPGTLVVLQVAGNLGNFTVSQGTLQYGDGVTDGGFNGYAGASSIVNNGDVAANLPLGALWSNGFGGTGTFSVLAGTQTFSAQMTAAGGVRIYGGGLRFTGSGRLPVGADVTITGGQLDLSGLSHVSGNLILNGTGSKVYVTNTVAGSAALTLNGNLSSATGAATVDAKLVLPLGNHNFTVSAGSLTLAQSVSGPGSLSVRGNGAGGAATGVTVSFTGGPMTWGGATTYGTATGPVEHLRVVGSVPSTTDLTVHAGATASFVGSQTVRSLAGAPGGGGLVEVTGSLTISGPGTATYGGLIASVPSGPTDLIKSGTGTQTLTGGRTVGMNLFVDGGVLRLPAVTSALPPGFTDRVQGIAAVGPGARLEVGSRFEGASLSVDGVPGLTGAVILGPTSTFSNVVSLLSGLSITNDGGPAGARTFFGRMTIDQHLVVRSGSLVDLSEMARAFVATSGAQGLGGSASSATLATVPFTQLGIVQNRSNGLPLFSRFGDFATGTPVFTFDVLAMPTWTGDANLDGILDARDFNAVLNGWTSGLRGWQNGDSNYDGVVNAVDFNRFLAAYSYYQTNGFPLGPGNSGGASIPEPSAAMLLAPAGMLLTRRRR